MYLHTHGKAVLNYLALYTPNHGVRCMMRNESQTVYMEIINFIPDSYEQRPIRQEFLFKSSENDLQRKSNSSLGLAGYSLNTSDSFAQIGCKNSEGQISIEFFHNDISVQVVNSILQQSKNCAVICHLYNLGFKFFFFQFLWIDNNRDDNRDFSCSVFRLIRLTSKSQLY